MKKKTRTHNINYMKELFTRIKIIIILLLQNNQKVRISQLPAMQLVKTVIVLILYGMDNDHN